VEVNFLILTGAKGLRKPRRLLMLSWLTERRAAGFPQERRGMKEKFDGFAWLRLG